MPNFQQDRLDAAKWAHDLLEQGFLILDTETTGLDNEAEICDIAITDHNGRVIFSSLVRPTKPIPADATRVHGITDEMVASAPTWGEVLPIVLRFLQGQRVVIYNVDYDTRILKQSCILAMVQGGIDDPEKLKALDGLTTIDAMVPYSAYCGDWNDYHGNYKWQRLPAGDHSAAGDCKATAKIIQEMAQSYKEEHEK